MLLGMAGLRICHPRVESDEVLCAMIMKRGRCPVDESLYMVCGLSREDCHTNEWEEEKIKEGGGRV